MGWCAPVVCHETQAICGLAWLTSSAALAQALNTLAYVTLILWMFRDRQ
jgi:hypothetical protein